MRSPSMTRCDGRGKVIEWGSTWVGVGLESFTKEKDCSGCEDCRCPELGCDGTGSIAYRYLSHITGKEEIDIQTCPRCHGTGRRVKDE